MSIENREKTNYFSIEEPMHWETEGFRQNYKKIYHSIIILYFNTLSKNGTEIGFHQINQQNQSINH